MMRRSAAVLAALATSLSGAISGAEFQTGQAARAVIGQSSFSARDAGIVAHALTASKGRLYAADASNHVLTFDLAKIPGPKDDLSDRPGTGCSVCGFAPVSVANQAVIRGVAGAAAYGKTVVVADAANHRVLIWRDSQRRLAKAGYRAGPRRQRAAGTYVGGLRWQAVVHRRRGPASRVGMEQLYRLRTISRPMQCWGSPISIPAATNDVPGANTLHSPAALVSDGTNLFVADAADRQDFGFYARRYRAHGRCRGEFGESARDAVGSPEAWLPSGPKARAIPRRVDVVLNGESGSGVVGHPGGDPDSNA